MQTISYHKNTFSQGLVGRVVIPWLKLSSLPKSTIRLIPFCLKVTSSTLMNSSKRTDLNE